MQETWAERMRSLLEGPSPSVLTTYREDGSALVSPVWFRWIDGSFEIVILEGDVKLRHLGRDPRCGLVVFEAVPPFRGVEVVGTGELSSGDVATVRAAIAARYLGVERGQRFVDARKDRRGVVVRLHAEEPRVWDLAAILPA
ncbi:MAG TPA: pyridoxamine 5'-phosphate oxidase family protein [Actinomycetota bacterium]|nr:pyridoxamine 5'-phosphate oxidase family protein [Actinomycetota bacterium]